MDTYEFQVGAETVQLTDAQLDSFAALMGNPITRTAVPPFVQQALKERDKHRGGAGGALGNMLGKLTGVARKQGAGNKTSNILSWGFESMGASGNVNVYASDPFEIDDIRFDSDDATARVTLIKFGSAVLYEAASGSGIRATQFNNDGFFRAYLSGLTIDQSHPLIVAVTNASSGTPKTTLILYGKRSNPGCAI